tara:strand:+ start:11456 stop:11650 length:195 start_codon:yes stop_codon:yes gene_type:complete
VVSQAHFGPLREAGNNMGTDGQDSRVIKKKERKNDDYSLTRRINREPKRTTLEGACLQAMGFWF